MGIIISLSGVDNAGKSTQCKLLKMHWRKHSKKVIITEFAFGYYLLKPLVKPLRKATNSPTGGPVKKNNNVFFKLWFIPAFFDIWVGYLAHLRNLKNKYDVVLCDRFYTDIWVNLLYYGYIPKWAFLLFVKYLPKSDKAVLLTIKPKTGHKRINDEFPLQYYTQQVRLYNKLSELINCTSIASGGDPALVNKKILKAMG